MTRSNSIAKAAEAFQKTMGYIKVNYGEAHKHLT